MTFADKETLDDVEIDSAARYFGVIETAVGPMGSEIVEPVYGLIDAQFPDDKEPVDADETRLMVVEDVSGVEEGEAQKLATLLFKQKTPHDIPAAEVIIAFVEPPTETEVNPLVDNPRHAGIVIEQAALHFGLERVQANPTDVDGVKERCLNAASFLVRAGLTQVDEGVFELSINHGRSSLAHTETLSLNSSYQDQELLAAA